MERTELLELELSRMVRASARVIEALQNGAPPDVLELEVEALNTAMEDAIDLLPVLS